MKKLLIMNYIATVISNLSNGYIHLYWTGPPTSTSYGKCTGRCFIEKKNGGNIISSLHIVSMIFVLSLSMWSTFNLLEHISLKKWLISMNASHITFDNKSRKSNGMSVCINTWQSWLFIPYNLHSSVLTSLDMFKACPCTITLSTVLCDWCHVMCSAILGDMNNLCNLGVVGKYLSFLYATRFFPMPVLGL
jgi:hypothetical protein